MQISPIDNLSGQVLSCRNELCPEDVLEGGDAELLNKWLSFVMVCLKLMVPVILLRRFIWSCVAYSATCVETTTHRSMCSISRMYVFEVCVELWNLCTKVCMRRE